MKKLSMITRRIEPVLVKDLRKKMVLLSGPRQCGKTTLAKKLLAENNGHLYNWDIASDRKSLLRQDFHQEAALWVFDELHKYRKWKNWIKGVYDEYHEDKRILVTGSAHLNIFKKGGDSLQGRYFPHRLHPFTLSEISMNAGLESFKGLLDFLAHPMDFSPTTNKTLLDDLLLMGGFPEPFISSSEHDAKRWRLSYAQRIIEEDLRQLHNVREIEQIELLFDRLPEIAISSITMKRLAFDLEVAFESVKSWLTMFEELFTCFRIAPFGLPKVQAVKRQQKLFLWDWARIDEPGSKLENLVALHLLRLVHYAEDIWGEKLDLRYYRDQQGHEVDFLILHKRNPLVAVEVKSSEQEIDSGLDYLCDKVRIPHMFQLHLKGKSESLSKTKNGHKVWKLSINRFLSALV